MKEALAAEISSIKSQYVPRNEFYMIQAGQKEILQQLGVVQGQLSAIGRRAQSE